MAPPLKRSVLGTATWKASEYFSRLSQKPIWCTDREIRQEDEETLCAVLRLCLQERQESSGWHESCWGNIDSYVTHAKMSCLKQKRHQQCSLESSKKITRQHTNQIQPGCFQHAMISGTDIDDRSSLPASARSSMSHLSAWNWWTSANISKSSQEGDAVIWRIKIYLRSLINLHTFKISNCDAWCDKNKNKNKYNNSSSQLSFLQCNFAYRLHVANEIVWHSFPQMERLAFKRCFCHVSQLAKTT